MSAGGNPARAYVDMGLVRKGRFTASLTHLSAADPYPSDLQRDVVTRVVDGI